jgi:hypothetical protein
MGVHGPVIDPFAERVGIEHAAKQSDGLFAGIPILVGVASRNSCTCRVLRCCLTNRLLSLCCRLLGWCGGRTGRLRGSTWSRLVCFGRRLFCYWLIRGGLIIVIMVISSSVPIKKIVGCCVWRRSIMGVIAVIDKDILPVRRATPRVHLLSLRRFGELIVCAIGGCSLISSRTPFITESTYICRIARVRHEGGVPSVARRRGRKVLLRVRVWWWYSVGRAKARRRMAGSTCVSRNFRWTAGTRCPRCIH